MIISLIKEETSKEFIEKMEEKYNSYEQLEEAFQKTKRTILHVDLENWKYLKNNPEETIQLTETLFTNELNIGENEIELLNLIKSKTPKSIRELAKIIDKDISTIQPKIKKLENEGLIELKQGGKNSKIPIVNYDKIEIAI
ncbi:HVO_A0114 family putative DNA-binding protein [Methanobrevibacter filiformis]|uniref:Sugar-specific transcriptional regulator TrmB n=1 Tax=Methanobrevibacter filiformis TaxID=55758 RepID=A0A166FG33_9EURY|nr:MarR family transcriptional regulator [Methanobrevibacter filiformis]KZX17639.1 sugar-specific transcriptional regulator TrmB [Methanobrevibacter filiformis]